MKITIENLKQIPKLEFSIPSSGVHVISGVNGSGKSTLLACILRIGDRSAFQRAFKTSQISTALDNFSQARIKYELNTSSVTYRHSGSRWEPTPKGGGEIFRRSGYASIIYAAANSERIEPRADDFSPQRIRNADQSIRDAAVNILGDSRFSNLKTINVRRGTGAEAFLLPLPGAVGRRSNYFSEKNFSLGELCVLKLLRQLSNCPDRSLVLIDELELALHPQAQIRLFNYLKQISDEKNLTTIFSTHSASLIKTIDRRNLHFIDKIGSNVNIISGCYPAYALGQLALTEEACPDRVIFVEDDQAKFIVSEMVRQLISINLASSARPTVSVVPVGPISSVVSFITRSNAILPNLVGKFALLDNDALTEFRAGLEASSNHTELAKLVAVDGQLNYLPWTPEVGICDFLCVDIEARRNDLRQYFNDHRINLALSDVEIPANLTGSQRRSSAKNLIRDLIVRISGLTLKSDDRVRQDISEYFAKSYVSLNRAAASRLIMPMIS